MSATDPLRELASELRALGEEWRGEWPDGRVCKAELGRIAERLEALAAVPAEPERDGKRAAFLAGHGTLDALEVWAWAAELGEESAESAIESDEPLMVSVLPGEPEAWEWHAGYITWSSGLRETMEEAVRACLEFRGQDPEWVERRRPGTAPGEWERVDPEPQPTDQAERIERRAQEISAQLAEFTRPEPYEPRLQDGGE